MNIIFARGKATATEVMNTLDAPPTYSAVRATLRVLEQKGHLKHQHDGNADAHSTAGGAAVPSRIERSRWRSTLARASRCPPVDFSP